MRIAITGATGFLGRRLLPALVAAGHVPLALVRARLGRDPAELSAAFPGVEARGCDPLDAEDLARAIEGCEAVINLAGENILGARWSSRFLDRLRASRIATTDALVRAMAAQSEPVGVLLSASAIGIYGPREPDEEITEATKRLGHDVLAVLCRDWEAAALRAEAADTRVVLLRLGVVLGRGGGALAKMEGPFRWGLGGRIGGGRQVMSWIHVEDVVGLILFALGDEDLRGPLHLTAPGPVSNAGFTKALAASLRRPAILRVPAFALRLRFGRGASVLTTGQRVVPARAEAQGYAFAHPELAGALADLHGP